MATSEFSIGLLLGILILLLGIGQLLLVIVQHLAGLGELDIGLQLLLGIAAHDLGELVHQAGHVVHGLDGALQRVINVAQALLHLQIIDQLPGRCAGGVALRVQALLQILQSGGQLIGDIAQLRHDLDQRIDILHSGLVELVHDPLQAVPHIDQGLLDLRLLDHSDQAVHTFQKSLRLRTHRFHCGAHLGAHLAHDRVGHRTAKVFSCFRIPCVRR